MLEIGESFEETPEETPEPLFCPVQSKAGHKILCDKSSCAWAVFGQDDLECAIAVVGNHIIDQQLGDIE